MSTFIDEHINTDAIYDIGKVYTQELGNFNGSIRETGVKLSSNRTLLLRLGFGTTLPVVGEFIPKLNPVSDHLSMNLYQVQDSMKTAEEVYSDGYDIEELGYSSTTWHTATHEDRCAAVFRFTTMKRMKERQALTLDAVSYNSQGMVHFGNAKDAQAPILLDMNTFDFGSIDRQLSTYNLAKISREVTAVMFNKDNTLCLAINREEIQSDFRGMIEYEILDTHTSSEKTIEVKRLLVTDESHTIDYIPVTEGLFIDKNHNEDIANVVEVIQSTCESSVVIGDEIISYGDWFAINKTAQSMRVSMQNGQTIALDPYGIVKAGASQPMSATTFKSTYTRPSTVSGNIASGLLYKDRSRFDKNLIGNYFLENVKNAVYEITPSSVLTITGSGSDTFVGPYNINRELNNIEINQFGDNNNAFYALRLSDVDIYFNGDDVFAKLSSDLNFSQVVMPEFPDENGEYSVTIGTLKLSTKYKVYSGSVHRDKEFMYESNFMITNSAVVGEIVGTAYPTTFFRITRQNTELCQSKDEYPLPDGHVNSKNSYQAGEVSVVYSRNDGSLQVANNKIVEDDTITYSYLAVAGKISENPMIVESFGFVTRDTMDTIPTEHFLSLKIRDSYASRTRKRYAGTIERATSPYNIMWIKLRFAGTNETTVMIEQEYDDEHACHLGYSEYLSQRGSCYDYADYGLNKLSWVTNALKYTQMWSKTGMSIVPDSINVSELTLNKAIRADQLSEVGTLDTKSTDTIDGIGVTALSSQSSTGVYDTNIIDEPAILRTDDTLHDRMTAIVVPKVGFIYYTDDEIDIDNILSFEESEIIEPFKRGIRTTWDSHILDAYLEYRPEETNVFSVYKLTDLSNPDEAVTIEQKFPDGATSSDTMYAVDELYNRKRDLGDFSEWGIQKCIPMYLANTLLRQYGHVQNIVAVWDESSSVIINDAAISFEDTIEASGHKITPTCSGAEPIYTADHYAMISVFKTGKPYDVSDKVRICFSKYGVINGFEEGALEEADSLYLDGKETEASKRILDGITKNIIGIVSVQVSPMLFSPQGPWKNTVDYVSADEKILLSGDLSYDIKPKSRIIMRFNVGPENILRLNKKGRQFDEMYDTIDGYVEEELVTNDKKNPLQIGNTSYSLKYINHAGSGILLDRSIIVDLQAYPARLSYPANNLIRELITPIREDGHSKKMDARSVYVRFDTRYVSESIHSYYDKFTEAPTALTCDLLPEEAVLNRDHENDESLYDNLLDTVNGNDLIATGGKILLSFDNNTEEVQTLTPVYDNTKYSYTAGRSVGVSSFKIDDAYRLMKHNLLFRGGSEENPDGRVKLDGKFVNSEIEGA